MRLQAPTIEDCEIVRQWRNDCLYALRTPYPLTKEQQERFYHDIVCNPNSPHRYYSIVEGAELIAFGGITNIQWENSIGEISLIVNPLRRQKGRGTESVQLLLDLAFNQLGIKTVCGEVYDCNPDGVSFWENVCTPYPTALIVLPNRKFWRGGYYNSMYFSIDAGEWRKTR